MMDRSTRNRNTRNFAEEAPIRGPEWTDAKFVRTSLTMEARKSVSGMFGLPKHFNALVDSIRHGIDAEANVTVDSDTAACRQKSRPTQLDHADAKQDDPKKHTGAFAFLNGRKGR